MGERHHKYVWYDGNSNEMCGGQASISQRHLGSDGDALRREEVIQDLSFVKLILKALIQTWFNILVRNISVRKHTHIHCKYVAESIDKVDHNKITLSIY